MTAATPETKRPGVRPVVFWFAVAGGTAAWLLHLLAGYWTIELSCPTDAGALPIVLSSLTVLLTAVAAAACYAAWWTLRRLPDPAEGEAGVPPPPRPPRRPRSERRRVQEQAQTHPAGAWDAVPGTARNRFLVTGGLYMNLLSLVMVTLGIFPVLAMGPCW
ncbi:hypothetical protein [Blastococcus saxobsidens]|uniref:Uncharacterized protein n=1 Tax=Blastococcus saxobsidens (strain DD2) TaxID=1146883 RepID=H6RNJ9_BLASD|nr:hypothetical protein [Blastococcus saxobsidens]CCG03946.1 membrane protein of unknown function [Blastococcus saxobsidens DD2]